MTIGNAHLAVIPSSLIAFPSLRAEEGRTHLANCCRPILYVPGSEETRLLLVPRVG